MDDPTFFCRPCDCIEYEDPFDFCTMDFHAFPLTHPVPPPANYGIPAKLLALMAKYKCSWRITELAKPWKRRMMKKFEAPKVEPSGPVEKKKVKMDEEIVFYSEHLAKPRLRTLYCNKKLWLKTLDPKHRKKLRKTIKLAWLSIYTFYKMRERNRRLRQQRLLLAQRPKKVEYEFVRTETLALPKKLYKPKTKPKKKKKTFKECPQCQIHVNVLASPKVRPDPPFNKIPFVKRKALTYKITKRTMALTKPFPRFKEILPPLKLGKVNRGALLFVITPRLEELAVARKRGEGGKDDDDWNPFAISKNALKYRASKRIQELAQPRKRD